MNLSKSVQHDKEVEFTKNSLDQSKAMQYEQEVPLERSTVSPVVNVISVAPDASAAERGDALNRNENSTNLHGESPLPLEEVASLVVKEDENGAVVGVNGNDNSVQLLEVENILTPPSSSESNSMFSPHTPSGSPSHLGVGGGSTPLEGSSAHLVPSPLNSKIVHIDSSSSLASSGPFSPHTPVGSPSVGGAPIHFLVGSSAAGAGGVNVSTGVVDISVVKDRLNFESLELKSTVPVIISWAASPDNFTVSGS
jgi:hypothetical protein